MKYKVTVYRNGEVYKTGIVDTKSYKEAAKNITKSEWTHIKVEGKKTRRYRPGFSLIKDVPTFHKGTVAIRPCILILFGTTPELVRYYTVKERDKAWEEIKSLCTILTSVGSAEIAQGQIGIIASSGAISDFRDGSMSRKTSSGSATNVIWQEKQIPTSIARSSGSAKSKDTAKKEWIGGWTASPSKPNQIFAKIIKPFTPSSYPAINSKMLEMQGKVGRFKKDGGMYYFNGWLWKEGWLDTERVPLKIKNIVPGTWEGNEFFSGKHSRLAGKTISLSLCSCGCGTYQTGNMYFHQSWLEIPERYSCEPTVSEAS